MPSVAENLGITQPAVSIAVRQMEDSIGVACSNEPPEACFLRRLVRRLHCG